jgi:GNAT superfamily N-acetyltransferase
MSYEISVETSAGRGRKFWADMGPFFASRALAKELGGELYDDASMAWAIARLEGAVVGWAACRVRGEKGYLEWSWVHADHRQRGLWRRLHKARVQHMKELQVTSFKTSTRDEAMVRALEAEGLKKIGMRGCWTQMERVL